MTKQAALVAYSAEIGPIARDIEKIKARIKDFKETDEGYLEQVALVKEAQEAAKAYLEKNDDFKEMQQELKEKSTELSEALKGAARATKGTERELKAGELKPYFVARNKPVPQGKPTPVAKVIDKGDTFEYLEEQIKTGEV